MEFSVSRGGYWLRCGWEQKGWEVFLEEREIQTDLTFSGALETTV